MIPELAQRINKEQTLENSAFLFRYGEFSYLSYLPTVAAQQFLSVTEMNITHATSLGKQQSPIHLTLSVDVQFNVSSQEFKGLTEWQKQ